MEYELKCSHFISLNSILFLLANTERYHYTGTDFLYRRPMEHTVWRLGCGCSETFDFLTSMSYTHENRKTDFFVYPAPEKKLRSPHQLQSEKKVPLDNAFPAGTKILLTLSSKGSLCQSRKCKHLTQRESDRFHHTRY